MGRCAFRKSQKSVQNCANQHRTLCAINNFFRLNIRCFYGSKIKNIMRFAIFPVHLSKLLRLPRKKVMPGHTTCCIFSGNQRPHLLTALMNMSLVLCMPRKMHLSRSSSNVPRLPSFFEMLQTPHVLLTFDKVHSPLRLPRETTSEPPRMVRTPGVFNIWA